MRRTLVVAALLIVGGSLLMGRFFASRATSIPAVYGLINGQNGDGVYAIGAVTRTDGVWSEYALNPVLQKGSSGAWDDDHVKGPCLLWDGSQYVMYYDGYDGSTYQIGRATAPSHNGPWTKDAANPVLTVGSGGTFDDAGVSFATVYYEPTDSGKEWKMWYRADDGANQTVGYAYSSDGISWTKVGMVIDKGAAASWNDEGVLPGAIVKEAGTYYLYAGGRKGTTNPQWQGGLWTFTDPEGSYTADGSNPIMQARFNTASTSVVPSADVSDGATTVTMASTAAFNEGEPIAIADADTTAHIGYIDSIDSGTQVTLDRAVVGNFTGGGKVFRSFAYNSVIARSVLARPSGGYEAFIAPFQPVEDLTQPASKLWEGSMEMRADDLTGTWTYYYVAGRGLLFPLSIGAAWHTRSAENPSVIAAP